ncbi:alpha/beta fold hydrolase [Proteiniborus sp.]|uniref:alpha/beta fold hydrolase n=1 Tax=Proteiniborus sp. TaxID=2079015 RepID=UPI003317E4FE
MNNYLRADSIIEEKIYIGEIPAILFRPKEAKDLLPTIIFYHGWSSSKELQRIRGFILSAVGYQVIIPDAINHGERNPIDYNDIKNGRYFWDTIFKNLDESNDIIHELILKYNTDPNRIGVMGNSMGGFTAAGVFTHNPKLKSLIVLNGSCAWQNSNKIFKKALGINEVEEFKEIEDKINEIDPINNLQLLKDRPILMLHGDSDSVVSVESQRLFYKEIMPLYQDKNRIELIEYPNLNHFVTTNMMEESISWFYKYMR